MGYHLDLSVAASTTKANREETTVKIFRGVVYDVFVHIPRGSARKLKCRVLCGSQQIFPAIWDTWFSGDLVNERFRINYTVPRGGNIIKLQAYNDSSLFTRYVSINVTVLPRWVVYPQIAFEKLYKVLERFLVGGEK